MNRREKPRLLVLTSTYPRNDTDSSPRFVKHLSDRLCAHFEVYVLVPHFTGGARFEKVGDATVSRFRYAPQNWETLAYDGGILQRLQENPWRYLLVPGFLLGQLYSAVCMSRKHRIDVVHAHWVIPQGLVAVLLKAALRIPVIITAHGGDVYALRSRHMAVLKKWVITNATRLATVSTAMRDEVIQMGVPGNRVSVAPMGVDLGTTFIPGTACREAYRVLFVGRLVERKGVTQLIVAIQRIAEKMPAVRLDIVGDGPQRPDLESLTSAYGLDEFVTFHGGKQTNELVAHYQAASVFVMPSTGQEGLGLVVIEAMGCGCPVVASDLPALRDTIIDQETGLLFRSGDSDDMADKIEKFLNDEGLRRMVGRAGREFVLSRFDWPVVTGRYIELIEEIL